MHLVNLACFQNVFLDYNTIIIAKMTRLTFRMKEKQSKIIFHNSTNVQEYKSNTLYKILTNFVWSWIDLCKNWHYAKWFFPCIRKYKFIVEVEDQRIEFKNKIIFVATLARCVKLINNKQMGHQRTSYFVIPLGNYPIKV